MATVLRPKISDMRRHDVLSGTDRAEGLDRWIFAITALFYIVIVLVGFIPDSLMKVAMVQAGMRPPFPPILHAHAVLMGTFLVLLLAQTSLVAAGRVDLHRRIGPVAGLLGYGLIVVGFILAPTMYHQVWDGLQHAPPEAQQALRDINRFQDNILLLQFSAGILFAAFFTLGLWARVRDSGFHKRMLILAPSVALSAAFDRMSWLPSAFPANPISSFIYPLFAVAPLFLWDVRRNHRVHRAWWVYFACYVPVAIAVMAAWDTPWWHAAAHRIMGV
nr:hypothetical protein [uncultured Sphingomonas sp.]